MSSDMEEASTVLSDFMSAMRDWENKFAELFKRQNGGPEVHGNQARAELEAVYDNT